MMKTSGYAKLLVLPAIMSCANMGLAQTLPGAVRVGPMFLYPALEVAIMRDSNIAIQPAATAQSDTIGYLRPSLRLEAQQGVNIYSLGYSGEYGRYNRSTADNFENHTLTANANMTHDARNRLTAKLQYLDRVDLRGTLNLVATPTPNHFREPSISGLYSYGAEGAQGKLELTGGYINRRYLNNRIATVQLDHARADYGGTFLWRVQPKTHATFNFKQQNFAYKNPTSITLDSTETSVLVGVRWDATAATSANFALGRQTKRFGNAGTVAGNQDFSGPTWEVGINWRPLSYSSVDYNAYRRTSESTGLGNFAITQTHQVVWRHTWSSRVTSILTGLYLNDLFSNAPVIAIGGASREDTTKLARLRVNYNMRRWLDMGAEYTYSTRDSNDINFNYNRNQYMFFLLATL